MTDQNNYPDSAIPADNEVAQIKLPPHSVEAEQAVLGGLMLASEHWDNVAEALGEHDFYRKEHRLIFKAMVTLSDEEAPLDVVTLSESLDKSGNLELIGGLAYLAELAHNTPATANILAYAKIIHERAMLRSLIGASRDIAESAYSPDGKHAEELVQIAEQRLQSISESGPKKGGPESITPLLKQAVDKIDELFNQDGGITGITTGFDDLDVITSGWQRSDLIIVAARPAMGKTTFAMNLVENALMKTSKPCVVFSMEMPSEQLLMRMIASVGRIHQGRVRTGKLEEDDWPKLSHAVSQLKDKPLFIDDTPGLTPTDVRARVRRIQRDSGDIGMIMIDYLQLMTVAGNTEGRTAEIAEISRSLKAMAKEFNCPVIALSQLNRSLEQRPNKRPINSDLRESGSIEQDADIITFIYRDEVYNEDSPDKGIGEIILGKHRNGEIGTVRLAFLGKYSRFENLAPDYYRDNAE